MERKLEDHLEAQAKLRKVRFATELSKLILGVTLVLFGIYTCYELLKAILLLSQDEFVPLIQIITGNSSSSVGSVGASSAVELPEGVLQAVAVIAYLLLLAVFVSLARTLLSSGIRMLSIDNAKAIRELWIEMRTDLLSGDIENIEQGTHERR